MDRDKQHFRHVLLYLWNIKKTARAAHQSICETYGESAISLSTCDFWFRRFKNGDFDLQDKERSGQPKKFNDEELQALLDVNPAQTLKQLANSLSVGQSTISERLKAMGKIQKEGKWLSINDVPVDEHKSQKTTNGHELKNT